MAQSPTTGALTGTVTDPSGAVISGATVTTTNINTGQLRTATTDADGSYKLSLLPPGNYRVTFSAKGFKVAEVPSVTVNVTETPVLSQSLEVGAETQQVTVQATAETIQTQNATMGRLVGSEEITSLPLSSRNYTQVVSLSPGVVTNVASAAAVGAGTQDVNVNGQNYNQNNYLMDGTSVTNYGSGTASQSGNFPGIGIPNPDSIQEFKVQTSQYDAQYGKSPGANVNVVTKGGTNQFHGAIWEFNRNNFFNANDYFLKQSQKADGLRNSPPTLKQNQFGGTFGGPIKRDRLLFFGSYQGTRQRNGVGTSGFTAGFAQSGLLPFSEPGFSGADARADHAGLAVPRDLVPGNPMCDASTYRRYLGCAFAGYTGFGTGATIADDGSNINQVAINILQTRQATGTTPYNQGFYVPSVLYDSKGVPACMEPGAPPCSRPTSVSVPIHADENQFLINTDYIISSRHTLSERYFFSRDPQLLTFACLFGGCDPGAPSNSTFIAQLLTLKLTSLLTSNLLNEARFSFGRQTANNANAYTVTACDVGMIPMVNNGSPCPEPADTHPALKLLPIFGTLGLPGDPWGSFTVGGNFAVASTHYFTPFVYADQISWNTGKHAIRAGFEFEHTRYNWTLPAVGQGEFHFWNNADFLASSSGAPNTGTGPALGGILLNFTDRLAPSSPDRHNQVSDFAAAFAEDDIKVARKLTLNLGLRWEYHGFAANAGEAVTNVWSSQATLVNTGSFFLNNPVGTLAGFVVPSNYNPNSTVACITPCGFTAPNGATGVYVNTNKTVVHDPPLKNFGPRIGIAWQPLSSAFVVRAGYGIFFDRFAAILQGNGFNAMPPYAGLVGPAFTETLDNPNIPGVLGWIPRTLSLPYSNPNVLPPNPGAPPAVAGSALSTNSQSNSEFMGTPLVQQYNVDLQYQFAHDWVADIGYVGSHGVRLINWDQHFNMPYFTAGTAAAPAPNLPAASDKQDLAFVCPPSCPFGGSNLPFNDPNNTHSITVNTLSNILGRVPYLGYSDVGMETTTTHGDELYNSMQAQLRHQFSHGLLLQVSYTWSKLITNINNNQTGKVIAAKGNLFIPGSFSNNTRDLKQQYGLAAFNRPQRLVIAYSYDLPWKKTDGWSGKLLGGWRLSGVTTIQNGQPFTVVDQNGGTMFTSLGPFGSDVRAELADPAKCNSLGVCQSGIPVATRGSVKSRLNNYINAAAFGSVPCIGGTIQGDCAGSGGGTGFGNSAVGIITGPGQHNWDVALIKNTKVGGLREDANLQFRAEFFNVWNHAQFDPPFNTLNAPNFGVIVSTSTPPRIIQFALKYSF